MNSSNKILAPISIGELIDKITILEIKIEKIQDNNKQKFIKHELESLNKLLADINFSEDQKKTVNSLTLFDELQLVLNFLCFNLK